MVLHTQVSWGQIVGHRGKRNQHLHAIAIKRAMKNEAWVAMAARLGLELPNKFPTRTAEAMLKAYGAWKVVEAETRRTD